MGDIFTNWVAEEIDSIDLAVVRRGVFEATPLWDFIEELKLSGKVFIAGGYARWAVSPNTSPALAKDVDIYATKTTHIETLIDGLKLKGLVGRMSPTSIIWPTQDTPFSGLPVLNTISGIAGTPEKVIKGFDFSVCRVALKSSQEAIADSNFDQDEQQRVIRIKDITNIQGTVTRILYYLDKGYKINPAEFHKLSVHVREKISEKQHDEMQRTLQRYVSGQAVGGSWAS
jgi:hypothetical protein